MKSIETIVFDIYELLSSGKINIDADKLAKMIAGKLAEEQANDKLRMSNFGSPCERKLWYTVNTPNAAEAIPPYTKLKFLFGHIIEEVILSLAEQAGHEVNGRQDEVAIAGVVGHIDGVVDGVVLDVKSANSRSITKFRDHKLQGDDPFGYLQQLGLYLGSIEGEPRVRAKGVGAFLAVDKELGHLYLDTYEFPAKDWEAAIEAKKAILAAKEPPPRGFFPEPHNKSGNMKLGVACSYCPFKHTCYPNLRTFIYSTGPVYMTKVTKEPDVKEVFK